MEVSPVQNRLNVTTNIPRAGSKTNDNAQMITFDLSNEQILVLSEPNNTLEIYMDNQGHMSVRHMNMTDTLRIKNNASDGNISFEGSKQKYAHKLILEGRSFFNKTDLSVDFLQASFSEFFINDKPLIINKIQGVVTENQQCTISAHNFINNNVLTVNQSLKCTVHDMFQNNSNIKGDGDLTIVTTKMLNDAQGAIEIKGDFKIFPIKESIAKFKEFPHCPSHFCKLNTVADNNIQSEVNAVGLGIRILKDVLGNGPCLNLKRDASDPNRLGRDKFKGKDYSDCHEVLLMGRISAKSLKIASQLVALQGAIFVEQYCTISAPYFLRNSGSLQVKENCTLIAPRAFFNDVNSSISVGKLIKIRVAKNAGLFVNLSGTIIGGLVEMDAQKVYNLRHIYSSQKTNINDTTFEYQEINKHPVGCIMARNGNVSITCEEFVQEDSFMAASGDMHIIAKQQFNNNARALVHFKDKEKVAPRPHWLTGILIGGRREIENIEDPDYKASTIGAGGKLLVTIGKTTVDFSSGEQKFNIANLHNTGTIQGHRILEVDAQGQVKLTNGFTHQSVAAKFKALPQTIDLSGHLIPGEYEHKNGGVSYYSHPLLDEEHNKIQDVAILSATVNQNTPLLMSPLLRSMTVELALHEHIGRFRIPEFESDTAQLKELETNGLVYAIVHGALNPVEGHSWAPLPVDDGSSNAVARFDKNKKHLLIKIPTRSRPEKFFATLDNFYKHLSGEIPCTFLITCDKDDASMNNPAAIEKLKSYKNLHFYFGEGYSKVDAYNRDMQKHLDFDILLVASDDLEPLVHGFDKIMFDEMQKAFPDYNGILRFESATSPHDINQYPVVGKKYYDRFAYIYHPDYLSLYCDNELVDVAQSFNCERVIRRPLLKHNHPSFIGGEPDDLYKNNETPAIGKHDRDLYFERKRLGERNFGAKVDGGPTRMLEWRRQKHAQELAHQDIALPDNKKEIYRTLVKSVNGRLSPEEFEHRMEMLEAKTHTAVLTQEQIDTAPMPFIYYKKENRNGTVCLCPYLHVVKDVFEKLRHPEGLMEGKKVFLHGPQLEILNTGSIISFDKLEVKAESFTNQQRVQTTEKEVPQGFSETRKYTLRLPQEGTGIVLGLDIDITTNKDTINKGGTIQATQNVKLYSKEGNVVNTYELSEEVVQWDAGFWGKLFGKDGSSKSADFVKGKIQGGGDVSLLSEAGFVMNFASSIDAGRNLDIDGFLGAVTESCASVYKTEDSTTWSGLSIKNVMKEAAKVGLARLSAKGNLKIHSKNLVKDRGSVVDADGEVTFNGEKGNDIKPLTFKTHSYEEVFGFDNDDEQSANKQQAYRADASDDNADPHQKKADEPEPESEPGGTFYKSEHKTTTNAQSSLHRAGKTIRYITNGNNTIEIQDIISGEKVVFEAAGTNNVNGVTRCIEIDSTKWSLRAYAFGIPLFEPLFSKKFVKKLQDFAVSDPFVKALIATCSSKSSAEAGYQGAVTAGEFVRLLEYIMTNLNVHKSMKMLIAQRLGFASPTISFRLGRVGKHAVICVTTPLNLKTPEAEFKSGRPSHYGDMVFDGTKVITIEGEDVVFDPGDASSYKAETTDIGGTISYVPGVGIPGIGADYSHTKQSSKQHSLVHMQAPTSKITAKNMEAKNYVFGAQDATVDITVNGDCVIETKPNEEYLNQVQGAFSLSFDGKSMSGGFATADATTLTAAGQAGVAHGTKLKLKVKGKLTLIGAVLDGAPGSEIEANELEVKDVELKREIETAQIGINYIGGNSIPLLGGLSHEIIVEDPNDPTTKRRAILHSVIGKDVKLKINKGLPDNLFFDINKARQEIGHTYYFAGIPIIIPDFGRFNELKREWIKMRDNAVAERLRKQCEEELLKNQKEAKERAEKESKQSQQQSNEQKPGQKTSDQKKSGDKTEPGADGKEHKDEPGKKNKPGEKSKPGDEKQKPDGDKEKSKDDTSSGEKQKPEAKESDDSKAKTKEKSADENQQDSKKPAKVAKPHKPGPKQNKPNKKPQQDAEPDDKHEGKKQPKSEQTDKTSGEKPQTMPADHEPEDASSPHKKDVPPQLQEEIIQNLKRYGINVVGHDEYVDPITQSHKNVDIAILSGNIAHDANLMQRLGLSLQHEPVPFYDSHGNAIPVNSPTYNLIRDALTVHFMQQGQGGNGGLNSPGWSETISRLVDNGASIGTVTGMVAGVVIVIAAGPVSLSTVFAGAILGAWKGSQVGSRASDIKAFLEAYNGKDPITGRKIDQIEANLRLQTILLSLASGISRSALDDLLNRQRTYQYEGKPRPAYATAGEGECPAGNGPFNQQSSAYNQRSGGAGSGRAQQSGGQRNSQMPQGGSTKPNGRFENASYHHANSRGLKNPSPKNGQAALDNSFQIKDDSPRRIGISEGEFVILDRTSETPGLVYHGHVRRWDELNDKMQNILKDNNLVNHKGRIL